MKIKVNIPKFGERYCSNNVEYELFDNGTCYEFYKKGTYIKHNEYGPSYEVKDGSYFYCINDKLHRLNYTAYFYINEQDEAYYVFGIYIGDTKEEFIKNLPNILIPKNNSWL